MTDNLTFILYNIVQLFNCEVFSNNINSIRKLNDFIKKTSYRCFTAQLLCDALRDYRGVNLAEGGICVAVSQWSVLCT